MPTKHSMNTFLLETSITTQPIYFREGENPQQDEKG
jgi:hypothetical protein